MTDRRRNLFILLLVARPARGVARRHLHEGRRSSAWTSRAASSSSTRPSRPAAAEVTREAIDRSLDIMRERVDALRRRRARDPALGREPDRGQPARRRERRRAAQQVGTTRPAVLLRLGGERPRPGLQARPGRREVTGGQPAPIDGLSLTTRSRSASKCPAQATATTPTPPRRASTRSTRRPRRRCSTAAVGDARPRSRDRSAETQAPSRGRRGASRASVVVRDQKPTTRDAPEPDRWWVVRDNAALSRHRHQEPRAELRPGAAAAQPIVTFEFTDKGREAFAGRSRARSPSAARQRAAGHRRRGTPPSTSRSSSTTSSISAPFIDFQREPRRHRRRATARRSRAASRSESAQDLREPPQDRRAADQARADLALAGVGLARPAGARPGPDRRPRRLRRSSRCSCSSSTACSGVIAMAALRDLRDLLLRAGQAHPGHADVAGHRRPDPHDRRRRRREHRHLRTRQRRDACRQIGGGRHRGGLPEGHHGDHRRQHRHAPGGVHPLHPRHGGGQGLRLHARPRRHRLAVHGGARHAGDPRTRCAAPGCSQPRRPRCGGQQPRRAGTSWARRGGSSRCPA